MKRIDSLRTGRLLLRRWRDDDREPFAALNGDPETLVYFPATLSRAESDAVVDRIETNFTQRGWGLWALEVRGTGQFIGFTGLAPLAPGVPGDGVEIGWRLARPPGGTATRPRPPPPCGTPRSATSACPSCGR